MSDYQSVKVESIEGGAVVVEVTEDSHDSRALSSLFDEGKARGIDDGKTRAEASDWVKIGAMLLFGEKAMNGDVEAPEDEAPEPEQFVREVVKLEATRIGEGNSGNARYRARLRVVLKKRKLAKIFEIGETFGAVADLGGDFDASFG